MSNFMKDFKKMGNDEIGFLSFFEANNDVDFDIKRIYYIYDVPVGIKRGMHAHKELKQVIWCPYGEIEITLDDGFKRETFLLDSPESSLVINTGYWREMVWKKEGSVLCVAASEYYTEKDYIRNYDDFLSYVEKGYWNNED